MKFTAEIRMDNASFDDDATGELGRIIMSDIADLLASTPIKHTLIDRQLPLRDANGNYVGYFHINSDA